MNEGEILDMVNQLKDKFEKVEEREKKFDLQMLQFTKTLCGIYGMIRILDNVVDDRPELVDCLINEIRSEVSTMLFRQIDPENDD